MLYHTITRKADRTFMEFGMMVIPLEARPVDCVRDSNVTDARSREVGRW
jgi:hypothetical protein